MIAEQEQRARPPARRRLAILVTALLLATTIGGYVWHDSRTPKRFAAVVDGRLYRSGSVSPRQLKYLADRYGIRTVVSLLNPDAPESAAEREAAQRLGLTWYNVPLRGNGASTPADREIIRQFFRRLPLQPTLVHCAAGTNRTGLAIGMYRIHHDGWTYEQVIEEMLQFDFENEASHANLRDALAAEAALARDGKPRSAP